MEAGAGVSEGLDVAFIAADSAEDRDGVIDDREPAADASREEMVDGVAEGGLKGAAGPVDGVVEWESTTWRSSETSVGMSVVEERRGEVVVCWDDGGITRKRRREAAIVRARPRNREAAVARRKPPLR